MRSGFDSKKTGRRLLTALLWLTLSLASLRGWVLLHTLRAGDPPVWRLYPPTAFLYGSWPLLTVGVVALCLLYLWEIRNPRRETLRQVLGWTAAFSLAALLMYPLGSKDLFGYAAYARLHAFYDLNPYLAQVGEVAAFRADPFLKNMYWIKHGTPYGPLWTWVAYLTYRLAAPLGLIPLLFVYKLLGLVAHLLVTLLVYRLAGRGGVRAAALYGLNPLAIFELVANGHNDGFGILLLAVCCLAVLRKGWRGLWLGGLACAYKLSAGLALPFLAWWTLRREGWGRTVTGGLLAALVLVLLYLPFWGGGAIFKGLLITVGGYYSNSLPLLPLLLGAPLEVSRGLHLAGLLGFLLGYGYLLYRAGRGDGKNLLVAAGLGFLAYFLLGAGVVHRWYYLWPLALLLTVPGSPWAGLGLIQTLWLTPSYLLMLTLPGRAGDSLTYLGALVPALLVLWRWRGSRRVERYLLDRRYER